MTWKEFKGLEVDDICIIIRGHDRNRLCQVAFIEGEAVLIRSVNGKRFYTMEQYSTLKLTSYRELKFYRKKEAH